MARQQIVVHYIEHFPIDPLLQSGQYNGFGTVIDIRERDLIAAAKMQEDAERAQPYPSRDSPIARSIYISGPDDDVRNIELLAILGEEFILLDFCEAIGVPRSSGYLSTGHDSSNNLQWGFSAFV